MRRSTTTIIPEVAVGTRGAMPASSGAYARRKILALAQETDEPILYAQVRLTHSADPALPRPAVAQANMDVNGRPLRAHVAATTMHEAIDLLQARLRERLIRIAEHWEARRGGAPLKQPHEPHEWRHGSEPTHRPQYYPRPPEEREIVRHKSFTLARETPDEAVFELEAMDYDFHLYTDVDSGQDSVIYRDDAGYRLARTDSRPRRGGPVVAVPLTISEQPAPRLGVDEAVARLSLTGFPFVFFVDNATGRGNVLYHRYDGHYGLITPAR